MALRPVAISHGELNISIGNKKDNGINILHLEKNNSKGVCRGLNSFGVKPDDIISIFQALEKKWKPSWRNRIYLKIGIIYHIINYKYLLLSK